MTTAQAEDSKLVMDDNKTPTEKQLEGALADQAGAWPVFMLRGLILFFIGLAFVVFPTETVNVISILFGIMLLLEAANAGIQMCVITNQTADNPLRGTVLIFYFSMVVVNLTLGILAMAFPDETARLLMIIVAVWFVAIGFLQVIFVLCLGKTRAACVMFLGGALYLTFGIILLTDLDQGVVAFATFIGIVVMVFALQIICLACILKAMAKHKPNTGVGHGESADLTTKSEGFSTEESEIV